MGLIDSIVGLLLKLYGFWVAAGLIVWVISIVVVWLTKGYIELLVSLITSLVFFMIPFPFDLYVTLELDRISLVGQGLVFVLLLGLWIYLRSKD
jgi:hypothetical protein